MRDDAAVLDLPGTGPLVVSVDSVVEGVHVDLSIGSPGDVGWKALMGALSDLAAVGAAPLGALVALCVPGGSGRGDLALGVMAGVAEASAASGCPVVGGDVSEAGELAVAVTVLGTIEPGGRPPVSRAGARPGDVVLVTGPAAARPPGCAGCVHGGATVDDPARDGPPAAGGAVAGGRAGPGERGPRHDRRVRRPGARPAPAGRRLEVGFRLNEVPVAAGRDATTRRSAAGRTTSW